LGGELQDNRRRERQHHLSIPTAGLVRGHLPGEGHGRAVRGGDDVLHRRRRGHPGPGQGVRHVEIPERRGLGGARGDSPSTDAHSAKCSGFDDLHGQGFLRPLQEFGQEPRRSRTSSVGPPPPASRWRRSRSSRPARATCGCTR
jgi:hypothetical protein